MNIFYPNSCPIVAAEQLAYRHVVKMPTEHTQMISTRIRLEYGVREKQPIYIKSVTAKGVVKLKKKMNWMTLDSDVFISRFGMKILVDKVVMSITHANHPSSVWLRQNPLHEEWAWLSAKRMCEIYTQKSGKVHASERILDALLEYPTGLQSKQFVAPPACVDDDLKPLAKKYSVEYAYKVYLTRKYNEWLTREKPMQVEFVLNAPYWFILEKQVDKQALLAA